MPLVLLHVLLMVLEVPLGLPVTVDYGLPEGYEAGEVPAGGSFSVVAAEGGNVTVVPLQLDTIPLPEMPAFLNGDTLLLPGPVLLVRPMIPDSTLAPAFAPAPAPMSIPPGFPLDYLRLRAFWLSWGGGLQASRGSSSSVDSLYAPERSRGSWPGGGGGGRCPSNPPNMMTRVWTGR